MPQKAWIFLNCITNNHGSVGFIPVSILLILKGVAMKIKLVLVLFLIIGIFVTCGKKTETLTITGWDLYKDPYLGISFKYPQNWPLVPEGGRFSVFSSPDVMNRFYDYSIKGKDGIRIIVSIQKMDTLQALEQYISGLKTDLTNSGYDISTTEAGQLAKIPASQIHYSGVIDSKTRIEAIQIAAMNDSSLYNVKYEAFNELFTPYKTVLDTVLATLHLPLPKVAEKGVDPSIPSTEFEKFENDRLSISYPDNFETSVSQPKAPTEFSLNIKGYRQDSFIHMDIIPAKGVSAAKIVEQNARFYKETSRGTATIEGINTTFINYSPVKDIQSRVYFLVKNDRFYRIIFNYYAPMKKDFLPVFEKMVTSLVTK